MPGRYSTARDMARIAMAAYRSPVIRDAVRRKYYTFTRNDGRTITLKSTNDLLGNMPECNGMKTGYTNASGRCLISSATSRGRHVILVQFNQTERWNDARTLMNYGVCNAPKAPRHRGELVTWGFQVHETLAGSGEEEKARWSLRAAGFVPPLSFFLLPCRCFFDKAPESLFPDCFFITSPQALSGGIG